MKLKTVRQFLDRDQMKAWKERRRDAVSFPEEASEVGRLLRKKARARSSNSPRFFGEACVLSLSKPREVYYSSCKWLTNRAFAGTTRLPNRDHERLRQALHRHFGLKRLECLQATAKSIQSKHPKLDGKAPTAPDLWIVDRRGRHRFIEVKLPGDAPAAHQIAGMAAIARHLGRGHRLTVELVYLDDSPALFRDFCESMR